MANSYLLYTGTGSQTVFGLTGIDGWVNTGFIKVYVNDVLQTTGYTLINMTTTPQVSFTTAPALNAVVRLQRETARSAGNLTLSAFTSNVVDFNDGSVLTAGDLDKAIQGLVHVAQESNDSGSGALGLNVTETHWDAESKRVTNVADGVNIQDAVTMAQLTTATLFGGATVVPQVWYFNGNGTATYTLSPAPLATSSDMFLVEVGGVLQQPSTYTITASAIVFNGTFANTVGISVRNFGVSRNIVESVTTAMIQPLAVTTAKIDDNAVTAAKIGSQAVITDRLLNSGVTYPKIQNVTATDRLLGRSTAGAGVIEEIPCTATGRSMVAATDAAAQRSLLGLGGLALKSTIAAADITNNAITYDKLTSQAANTLLGVAATAGNTTTISCTAFARTLLDDGDAPTARSTLGLGTAATMNAASTYNDTTYSSISGSVNVAWTITIDQLVLGQEYVSMITHSQGGVGGSAGKTTTVNFVNAATTICEVKGVDGHGVQIAPINIKPGVGTTAIVTDTTVGVNPTYVAMLIYKRLK